MKEEKEEFQHCPQTIPFSLSFHCHALIVTISSPPYCIVHLDHVKLIQR
jgi:hypothetical protein